ncbi:hypothetical protein LTR17_020955 [Elasticomyces elasticus]|nr:hypothetical protein LTR17_020955 [Elasticomyces elasticus]
MAIVRMVQLIVLTLLATSICAGSVPSSDDTKPFAVQYADYCDSIARCSRDFAVPINGLHVSTSVVTSFDRNFTKFANILRSADMNGDSAKVNRLLLVHSAYIHPLSATFLTVAASQLECDLDAHMTKKGELDYTETIASLELIDAKGTLLLRFAALAVRMDNMVEDILPGRVMTLAKLYVDKERRKTAAQRHSVHKRMREL